MFLNKKLQFNTFFTNNSSKFYYELIIPKNAE